MDADDRIALHELAARYGDLIDTRDWEGLSEVFTDDAEFDMTAIGGEKLASLAEIRRLMAETTGHPLGHLITNIYVQERDGRTVLRSRVLGPRESGELGRGWYVDDVTRTNAGWRIRRRVFSRTPPSTR